jgi:pSer/pThr/pTyr-binding forkhead associated (FHA) protein
MKFAATMGGRQHTVEVQKDDDGPKLFAVRRNRGTRRCANLTTRLLPGRLLTGEDLPLRTGPSTGPANSSAIVSMQVPAGGARNVQRARTGGPTGGTFSSSMSATAVLPGQIAVTVRDGQGTRRLTFSSAHDRRVLMGRAPDCDIPLVTSQSSRRHSLLLREGASWLLMDLGSTNGTCVRGQRIRAPTPVHVGDVIAIGDATIVIDEIGPQAAGEPAASVLVVDLGAGQASFGGEPLPLSAAEFMWFAYLARSRLNGDGFVDCGVDGHAALRAFVTPLLTAPWAREVRTQLLAALVRGEDVDDEDLKNLRGKTTQKLKRWCEQERARFASVLLPERRGRSLARLPLGPQEIQIIELPRPA